MVEMPTTKQSLEAAPTADARLAETLPLEPLATTTIAPRRLKSRWRGDPTQRSNEPSVEPPQIELQLSPLSWRRRLQRCWPLSASFLASLAVHLAALLVAAWVVVPGMAQHSPPLIVQGSLIDLIDPIVELEAPSEVELSRSTSEPSSADAAFSGPTIDPGASEGGAPEILLASIEAPVASERPPSDAVGMADRAGTGQGAEGSGEGSAGGDGEEGKSGTEFFGIQATGNKFVFVCDCSRSMTGAKWFELQRELSRCIESLHPYQSFYLLFFDGEMHAMFEPFNREPALLEATPANIEKARLWIANVSLGRNTSPFESMKFGADFEPDAMFLLTDGEFDDYTAPYMRDLNKKRRAKHKPLIAVHTIGFYSEKHQMVLQRIAHDSGGTYKFVKEPHVPRPKRKSWNVVAPPLPTTGYIPGPLVPGLPVGRVPVD